MSGINSVDSYNCPPFWQNGPSPGAFYNFPQCGNIVQPSTNSGIKHSQSPVTTGTSVLGFHIKNGVMVAADIAAYYGSLARFKNVDRIMQVNENVLLGAGGDIADFQYIKKVVDQKIRDEKCIDDGFSLKSKSLYCWLTRVMYRKRSNFDPLWNNFVIAGLDNGEPFLGTVDKLGTAYEDQAIATGFGSYLAVPMMREVLEQKKELSVEEGLQLIQKMMAILYYRDSRSYPKYQVGIITKDKGIEIIGPINVDSNWDIAPLLQAPI